MWDYDKLFAEGNVVGFKNEVEGRFGVYQITKDKELPREARYYNFGKRWDDFKNYNLAFSVIFIQYIIRLDEHGNVVEKLFDRNRDMEPEAEPMPELETGMFIRVYDKSEDKTILAFVYKEGKRVIYQDGDFDDIADVIKGDYTKIVEVYPESVLSFNCCYRGAEIWRSPESN